MWCYGDEIEGYIAYVGEVRNAHTIVTRNFEMKTPFLRTAYARQYNIKVVLK
jgi:hypothetical protein